MSTNYVQEASFVDEEGILAFADEEQVGDVDPAKAPLSSVSNPSTDVAEEIVAGEEKVAVSDAETADSHLAPKAIAQDEKAIVEEEIRPGESGRVRFQSSWWPATSDQDITFKAGEAVRVIAINNVTLIVEG
ncbi:NfeD family protein [Microcoleus sp. bin38.metabat.b11b12b14.051]|uniref:NfeD family protein n=1 Tax=Microcoleus sp. bin38.metabat.b11b12b14.051 TaxID=2742709 RepID=UPI0025F0A803|nr:NfeD family protein [Microcoleus sp. bin38.metabat.b11b12b14.051]